MGNTTLSCTCREEKLLTCLSTGAEHMQTCSSSIKTRRGGFPLVKHSSQRMQVASWLVNTCNFESFPHREGQERLVQGSHVPTQQVASWELRTARDKVSLPEYFRGDEDNVIQGSLDRFVCNF